MFTPLHNQEMNLLYIQDRIVFTSVCCIVLHNWGEICFSLYFSYMALTYVVVWVLCLVRWLILVCCIVSCDWVWVLCLISTVCDSPNDHRLWVLIDQNQNTIKSTHHSLICPPLFWSLLISSCPMCPSLTSRGKIGECCVPCYHCDTLLQQKQKVWEWEISSKWSESQRALSTPQLEINSSDTVTPKTVPMFGSFVVHIKWCM